MQEPSEKGKSCLQLVTSTSCIASFHVFAFNCGRSILRVAYNDPSFSYSHRCSVSDSVLTLALPTPEDTDRLGARLSEAFGRNAELLREKGFALRLEGNLGAGKTSLVRAMLRAAGFAGPVKSPTFSLVETYPVWGVTLAHFDFYRFEDPIEFEDAGFRDDFAPGTLTVTEWSEKALPYLPDADAVIELEHDGLGRRARLRALTPAGRQIFEALECDAAN